MLVGDYATRLCGAYISKKMSVFEIIFGRGMFFELKSKKDFRGNNAIFQRYE